MNSIQHRWNAELSHPSVRLRDFYPSDRLRLVGPVQQLFPDGWPVLLQVVRELINGHAIDSPTTSIGLHLPQCFLQVVSLTYFLHQLIRAGWAFGAMHRLERFGLFPSCFPGFTRRLGMEVQFPLDILPPVAPEIHVLLASPLVRAFEHRSRLGLSVDSTFRLWEGLTSSADDMTYYALC